jgi:hypothetical protein
VSFRASQVFLIIGKQGLYSGVWVLRFSVNPAPINTITPKMDKIEPSTLPTTMAYPIMTRLATVKRASKKKINFMLKMPPVFPWWASKGFNHPDEDPFLE